jgi:hypothetical protein
MWTSKHFQSAVFEKSQENHWSYPKNWPLANWRNNKLWVILYYFFNSKEFFLSLKNCRFCNFVLNLKHFISPLDVLFCRAQISTDASLAGLGFCVSILSDYQKLFFWRFLELFANKKDLFSVQLTIFEKNRQNYHKLKVGHRCLQFNWIFPICVDKNFGRKSSNIEEILSNFWSTKQKQQISHCQLGSKFIHRCLDFWTLSTMWYSLFLPCTPEICKKVSEICEVPRIYSLNLWPYFAPYFGFFWLVGLEILYWDWDNYWIE